MLKKSLRSYLHRSVVHTFSVILVSLTAVFSHAATVDFHLVPSQSVLQVGGDYFGLELLPQPGPTNSSIAHADGIWTIQLDSFETPTTLEVLNGTLKLLDSGSWAPNIGGGQVGDIGSAPANVALQVTNPILGSGYGAIRNLELQVASTPQTISNGEFSAELLFDNTNGSFDYNLDILGVTDADTESLIGEQTTNDPFLKGRLSRSGTLMTLTIPIGIEALKEPDLFFTGELIANAIVSTSAGDLDGDGQLTASDADQWTVWIRDRVAIPSLDFDQNGLLDLADRNRWLTDVARVYIGDAGFDGVFDGADLIQVFQRGEYDDGIPQNSTWADGDWNGDGDFDSADLVAAFADGGYEQGPRAVLAVPEPKLSLLAGLLALASAVTRRRRHSL